MSKYDWPSPSASDKSRIITEIMRTRVPQLCGSDQRHCLPIASYMDVDRRIGVGNFYSRGASATISFT